MWCKPKLAQGTVVLLFAPNAASFAWEPAEAVQEDDNRGFCLACGAEAYNVEPDARKYVCETCGEAKVYGAEELLLMFG